MKTRDEINAYKRSWRALNHDKVNASKKQWNVDNSADQTAKARRRYAENRDEATTNRNAYNAKQREVGGKIYAARSWLNEQKAGPCVDCGGMFHPCAMDFDHVRGEKKFMLSTIRKTFVSELVKKRALEEIAKCDLVCACCHRVRTEDRRQNAC